MTSKLTREQLRERAQLKAKNLTYAISQRAFAGVRSELEEELQFLQCALACLEGVNSEPAPVVPEKCPAEIRDLIASHSDALFSDDDAQEIWNACRAAMLQELKKSAGTGAVCRSNEIVQELYTNSPVILDGYVMVPMRLTAENGAKGALSGEFSETKFVNCPECFGADECETCDGSGRIEITVPVTWTTIKEIWAKGVEHFSATPREVKSE